MTNPVFPMFLVDDYPDGMIQEKAWVQVTEITATGRAAEEWLQKEMPVNDQGHADDDAYYKATGEKTHQRPSGYAITGKDSRSVKPLDEYADCTYCQDGKVKVIDKLELNHVAQKKFDALPRIERAKLSPGRELLVEAQEIITTIGARIVSAHEEDCDECLGTGKNGEFIYDSCEPIPWETCEADHPEAMEFWVIVITDEEHDQPTVHEDQQQMDT